MNNRRVREESLSSRTRSTRRNTRRRSTTRSTDVFLSCLNCRRTQGDQDTQAPTQHDPNTHAYLHMSIAHVPVGDIKTRYKFCMVTTQELQRLQRLGTGAVCLCTQCKVCLTSEHSSERSKGSNSWPAYIFSILSDEELRTKHRRELWCVIPEYWRKWWLPYASRLSYMHGISIGSPRSFFKERTLEVAQVKKTLDELRILDVIELMDTHCYYPSVKCPWGCSAFLPDCTTSVPYDVIVSHHLDDIKMNKHSITPKQQTSWHEGIRPDFVTNTQCTLYNTKWPVHPSVVFVGDKGPRILCCGHHSQKTRGRFIHPPSVPFGPLCSKFSDQIAPAVLQPRTIKTSKRKQYTNSFQLSKLQGGFSGVDTCTIVHNGRHDKSDFASVHQDSLSIAGRDDVKYHLIDESGGVDTSVVDAKLNISRELFPEEQFDDIVRTNLSGATYVSANNALELEIERREIGRTMRLGDENGIRKEIFLKPPWPRTIVYVHKVHDYNGSKFPSVPMPMQSETCDLRLIWVTKVLVAHVPELWSMTNEGCNSTDDWNGWILHSIAKSCLTLNTSVRNNPFRKKLKDVDISNKLHATSCVDGYDPSHLAQGVGALHGVCVLGLDELDKWDEVHVTGEVSVVIIIRSIDASFVDLGEIREDTFTPPCLTGSADSPWECRLILSTELASENNGKWKGVIHARHGGVNLPWWWSVNRIGRKEIVKRCGPLPSLHDMDCAVFVRTDGKISTFIKDKYLRMIGIQSKYKCPSHQLSLVCSTVKTISTCCVDGCAHKADYDCPYSFCRNGICKDHFNMSNNQLLHCLPDNQPTSTTYHNDINEYGIDVGNNNVDSHDDSDTEIENHANGNQVYTIDEEESGDEDSQSSESTSDANVDTNDYIDEAISQDLVDSEEVAVLHADVNGTLFSISTSSTSAGVTNDPVRTTGNTGSDATGTTRDFVSHGVGETDHLMEMEDTIEDTEDNSGDTPAVLRTTNCGRPAISLVTADSVIGLHVLFNKYHSLLVRYDRRITATRLERNFVETIASKNPTGLPLLYPEGLLFPSIFWKMLGDGTTIGAIPGALLTDDNTVKRMGFASMYEHFRCRIMNTELSASTSLRYQFFAFDACLNLGIRGHDTRLILSRGFGEFHTKDGMKLINNDASTTCLSESIDTRPVVNKLAAAMGERMPTFFYTHTCSMKTHLGMRRMKEWLDSNDAVSSILLAFGRNIEDEPDATLQSAKDMLAASACSICVRSWMLISRIWMSYICNGVEMPIGKILKWWYRFELQELEANLPHIHSVLWHADDNGDPGKLEEILSMIRASIDGLVTPAEFEQYKEEGLLSSRNHLIAILDDLSKFLEHKHNRRCLIPASRRAGQGATIHGGGVTQAEAKYLNCLMCKVPDNRLISRDPSKDTFVYIEVQHTLHAMSILEKIGLKAQHHSDSGSLPEHTCQYHSSLIAKRHVPATSASDGIISPVLARLVVTNPNSDNVQYLDSYGVSKYLAKYVASIDKNHQIYLRAPKPSVPSEPELYGKKVGNTKITSVDIANKKMREKIGKKSIGRAMTQPEALMLLCQYPQVMTNIRFINVCTLTLEERPALAKKYAPLDSILQQVPLQGPINTGADIDASKVISSHAVRENYQFPEERCFRSTALLLATDLLLSSLSVDAITVFGMRPPELYFVRKPGLYLKWFSVDKMDLSEYDVNEHGRVVSQQHYCYEHLDIDYAKCQWIDGQGKIVKVRAAALPFLLSHMTEQGVVERSFGGNHSHYSRVLSHFRNIHKYAQIEIQHGTVSRNAALWEYLKKEFVCEMSETELPVIWYTSVNPSNANRFLLHVLLSMGEYDNEIELFQSGSLRNAFTVAGLLNMSSIEDSVSVILKRYVLEQLVNVPGGTKKFDRMLTSANLAIQELFMHDSIASDSTPPYLYTRLVQHTNEKQLSIQQAWDNNVVSTVLRHMDVAGATNLPALENILTGTNVQFWSATSLPLATGQSHESREEQQHAIRRGEAAISEYVYSMATTPKCIGLVGIPGAGKTCIGMAILMNAMSRGLRCGATSLLSERAIELGGTHFHNLLSLPVREKFTVLQQAEQAVARLFNKSNSYVRVLQRLDVLLLDEMGQLSAEMLSVMDIVLRRIRRSARFMGGILVVATMDILQLMPIEGRPPILSSHMLTSFSLMKLQHSVRSAADKDFCELQHLTRLMPHEFTPEIRSRFRHLVLNCCTFKHSFHDQSIPNNSTYVFGKKQPGRVIHDEVVSRRVQNDTHHATIVARDSETTLDGEWEPASPAAVKRITKSVREPAVLHLFVGAMYRITYNSPTKDFSQSQLAILLDIPNKEHLDNFKPIGVYVCPPGQKDTPESGVTQQQLIEMGWTYVTIGICPAHTVKLFSRFKGRRQQYGMKLHVCSTVHACMGHTLSSLVTKVSLIDVNYVLWERAQVVVLLSRTREGHKTIFVGDPEDTVEALLHALGKTNQYCQYMHMLMTNLVDREQTNDMVHEVRTIDQRIHPFRAADIALPDDNTGVVYLIVSCRDPSVTYIGQTNNLSRRIDEHNSTSGSLQTSSELLRPWALVAYVVGFGNSAMKRRAFESQWKYQRQHLGSALDVSGIADLAKSVIQNRKQIDESESLRFIRINSPVDDNSY